MLARRNSLVGALAAMMLALLCSRSTNALSCTSYAPGFASCVNNVIAGADFCVKYVFSDNGQDTWDLSAVSAASFATMQASPGIYKNLTGCNTDNCNTCELPRVIGPTKSLSCTSYAPGFASCVNNVIAGADFCVKYVFSDNGQDVWDLSAVSAASFATMQGNPSIYRNLTGCNTDNCNTCELPRVIGSTATSSPTTSSPTQSPTALSSVNITCLQHRPDGLSCQPKLFLGKDTCIAYRIKQGNALLWSMDAALMTTVIAVNASSTLNPFLVPGTFEFCQTDNCISCKLPMLVSLNGARSMGASMLGVVVLAAVTMMMM